MYWLRKEIAKRSDTSSEKHIKMPIDINLLRKEKGGESNSNIIIDPSGSGTLALGSVDNTAVTVDALSFSIDAATGGSVCNITTADQELTVQSGATLNVKGNIRNCYAEFNMQSRNNNKNFKSFMIKEDTEPYNKISKSYPSAEKLNRTPCEYWAAKRRCSRDPIFMNKYCQKSCAKRKSCIDNLESRKCDYLVDCSRRLNPMFNKTYCQNYKIDTK